MSAYQYYASVLPSPFKWCPHEDTDYNLLEAYGSRLFTPLLDLQSPQPTHLQLSKTDLVNTAKEFLKAYQSVVKENLQSHSYSQLLKVYMDAWKANIKIWYNLVVEQGKELNNKPYKETLFGNTQRLKRAISANQTSLIKLDLNNPNIG